VTTRQVYYIEPWLLFLRLIFWLFIKYFGLFPFPGAAMLLQKYLGSLLACS